MFKQIYNDIKEGFEKSWFRFLFKYTDLGKLLTQEKAPSAWEFFVTYNSSWWWNRLWFRSLFQNSNFIKQLDMIIESLNILKKLAILTEVNCNLVFNHDHPKLLADLLSCLKQAEILTQESLDVVSKHQNAFFLFIALSSLQQYRILTKANFDVVAKNAYPMTLADVLYRLNQAEILNNENRNIVANHPTLSNLTNALSALGYTRILTQEHFDALVSANHTALVSIHARKWIWDRIPRHLLTQTNFETLVIASEHANPMAELERVLNQILDVHTSDVSNFYLSQSKHTLSVHRSVSTSATKLKESYGTGLNLETKIKEIQAYVDGLDDSPKHLAAKRCIYRITAWDYTFTYSSDISICQLLALSYTAIQDESKRIRTLEDALSLFVEGLYEIQRGYNLNENGIDDESPEDRPICSVGTFNKLMEKLNGIHSYVEVYSITHEGAYAKFPKLVAHHALKYLNDLTRPEAATDYLSIKELLDSMQDNRIEPIWDKIKSAVEAELWSEFHEAYADNPNHQKFREIIDNGKDCNAPNLTNLYSKLIASSGYQAYLYQLEQSEQRLFLRLHQYGLWANRHESNDTQHAFDKQYGLKKI